VVKRFAFAGFACAERPIPLRRTGVPAFAVKYRHGQGDRVFVDEGRMRNNRPPSPVVWQKVTSMNGQTGWINGSYTAPERDR
jgi:hypothetical protein